MFNHLHCVELWEAVTITRTRKAEDALIGAFWEILGTKPIGSITVRELACSAGVHRSSFYLFFEDVYDLLDRAEAQVFSRVESRLEGHDEAPLSEWMLPAMTGFYEANAGKLTALLGPMGDPSFARKLKSRLIPVLGEKLGVDANDPDVAATLELALTLILSFLAEHYGDKGSMPAIDEMQRVSDVLWHGIAPVMERHSAKL